MTVIETPVMYNTAELLWLQNWLTRCCSTCFTRSIIVIFASIVLPIHLHVCGARVAVVFCIIWSGTPISDVLSHANYRAAIL